MLSKENSTGSRGDLAVEPYQNKAKQDQISSYLGWVTGSHWQEQRDVDSTSTKWTTSTFRTTSSSNS